MSQVRADERLIAELELALRDPEQRQRLADFFAIVHEWSLERKSQQPSAPNERDRFSESTRLGIAPESIDALGWPQARL